MQPVWDRDCADQREKWASTALAYSVEVDITATKAGSMSSFTQGSEDTRCVLLHGFIHPPISRLLRRRGSRGFLRRRVNREWHATWCVYDFPHRAFKRRVRPQLDL